MASNQKTIDTRSEHDKLIGRVAELENNAVIWRNVSQELQTEVFYWRALFAETGGNLTEMTQAYHDWREEYPHGE